MKLYFSEPCIDADVFLELVDADDIVEPSEPPPQTPPPPSSGGAGGPMFSYEPKVTGGKLLYYPAHLDTYCALCEVQNTIKESALFS